MWITNGLNIISWLYLVNIKKPSCANVIADRTFTVYAQLNHK